MRQQFSSLLIILAVAIVPMGTTFDASVASDQQNKSGAKPNQYPTFFKVYSKDGRESLTATCAPSQPHSTVDQVTCKFVHVRFQPPEPDKTTVPLTVEDALKADPSLAEEIRKDPRKVEQELRMALEKAKQDFCSSSSEGRIAIETKMRDPAIGPKKKSYFQQLIAACADKDPILFFKRMLDLKQRTCDLWVDHFTLEFKKVKEGQWLYQQETPGALNKVLKVYELTGNGLLWTLSETRVPTEGAEEKPNQTVWSWKYYTEYELPCDFISHGMIQFP